MLIVRFVMKRFVLLFVLLFHASVYGRIYIREVPLNQTKEWQQKRKQQKKGVAVKPLRVRYVVIKSDKELPSVPISFKRFDWTSKWTHLVNNAALKYQVPEALLMAVLKVESNFNPNAVSPKGAMGLMQLMPTTGREMGVKNFFDPQENIEAGAKYLGILLKQFHSVELALAAYNAGPGAVQYYGGIPPYPETRAYVTRIMSLLEQNERKIKKLSQ